MLFRSGTLKEFSRQRKGQGEQVEGINLGFKAAMFLTIFFFAWAPILLPIIDQGENNNHNSIYNEDWNGWSNYRTELENEGYNISSIQSSLSTIVSLNTTKHIILVCPGPNKFYNPASEIPFFLTAFKENSKFSMFI